MIAEENLGPTNFSINIEIDTKEDRDKTEMQLAMLDRERQKEAESSARKDEAEITRNAKKKRSQNNFLDDLWATIEDTEVQRKKQKRDNGPSPNIDSTAANWRAAKQGKIMENTNKTINSKITDYFTGANTKTHTQRPIAPNGLTV